MTVRRGGLGKGLGALIPHGSGSAADGEPATDTRPVAAARYRELSVHDIAPNPKQPRSAFDEGALGELIASIREVGVLQPVVVRETTPGRYELVMGERRWRACREAGLSTVPAIVKETRDDAMLRDALLENLHRADLNPLEEAAAYEQLLREFGATHDQLAHRVGRSRSHVTNTMRLMQLPPSVQRRVAAGVLSAGHARALLALKTLAAQEELAACIVAEGLSVRATEELVATRTTASAPTPTTPRAPRGQRMHAPGLVELSERLGDRFDTRVKVELGRRKGKIVVEFGSVDDLERIVELMAPGADSALTRD